MRKKRITLTQVQRKEVISRYVNGDSPQAIANSFCVTRQTIHLIVNQAGVKRIRVIGEEKG
jgi:transposase